MNGRVIRGILITLLVVGALAAVGVYAYSWGLQQGALQNAQIVVPQGDGVTAPVYPYGGPFFHYGSGFGRWGWGFGPLGCLFPILGFFLLFALLRGLFWGFGGGWRRGYWGGYGGWRHQGPPPMFEEWHKRAHGEAPPEPPKSE